MNKRFKLKESLTAIFQVGLGYLKSVLIFFGLNFIIMTICFFIFDLSLAPLIALGICILDILPVIGSGIVFIPWTIICFLKGNSTLGIQLTVLYIGLTILRQILEPFILGKNIGMRPLVTFISSILGLIIFGAAGLIIGPIVAAVLNAVYRVHMKNEK